MRFRHFVLMIAITPLALLAFQRMRERAPGLRVDPPLTGAFAFPVRPMAPKPAHALRLVNQQPAEQEVRVIESELSANVDRARANLRKQIDRCVGDWLAETGLPRDWQAPTNW